MTHKCSKILLYKILIPDHLHFSRLPLCKLWRWFWSITYKRKKKFITN